MMAAANRPAAVPQSLGGLRRRLTTWYAATFLVILSLLGIGMFAVITRRFDRDLDESLRVDTAELGRVAEARGIPIALEYVRIPERTLTVVDTLGAPFGADTVPPWIALLARDAWHSGRQTAEGQHDEKDRILRASARPVRPAKGEPLVVVAIADEVELEDKYAVLIAEFGAAAFVAVVLVVIGGWVVARQSTAPVERAIDHMRRFMADAAHELRTPLTVVRSRAEVALQRSRTPEDYVLALHGIERETERLGRIVEDLLMLARADVGERPLQRERVFLDDVTLDAAEAARAMAERKSIRVEVQSFEEAAVTGDASLLRQLALILLDNAIKYTEPNGLVHVDVTVSDGSAVLRVSDTGLGIPDDQLAHVFERFYRADAARTRRAGSADVSSEGAGLGLSIAQWIVEEHEGTIRIESAVGNGTTVIVQLPVASQSSVSSS
jgi:signal transduction histidine kinase